MARLALGSFELELVPPGVVLTSGWRNDEPGPPPPTEISTYCGVARNP